MGVLIATESVTIDGVMQGPGRPDEDTRGGFVHGGWGDGFSDDIMMAFMAEGMAAEGVMLFGRRTYEDLLHHWTTVAEPNPFTEHLVGAQKYVVSRKPDTVLAYPNSTLVPGEASETIATLKGEVRGRIAVIGSGELVRSLHRVGLVDGYVLLVHPIVLGSGTKLFGDGERSDLELERSATTTTGVMIGQYGVRR
ncbi:dihydrofolate reductase family protein [Gordonia sp. (in: high G+C Gram-positive bacteria)]|uniref:dihydrofolate reductase family protein n=1 Tax=Gordonia sp. (in: high G+C Gram-positive bacteria) TaxID=84139 RepID=UPI0039E40E41